MGLFRQNSMVWTGLVLVIFLFAAASKADVVTLKDGRVFEGKILSQSSRLVEIDCVVYGVRSVLTFRRTEVKSIELKPLESELDESGPASLQSDTSKQSDPAFAHQADPPTDRQQSVHYAILPLHGTFGEEIHADDVQKVLERVRSTSTVVVIDIESDGGYGEEARAVADVLATFDEDF